ALVKGRRGRDAAEEGQLVPLGAVSSEASVSLEEEEEEEEEEDRRSSEMPLFGGSKKSDSSGSKDSHDSHESEAEHEDIEIEVTEETKREYRRAREAHKKGLKEGTDGIWNGQLAMMRKFYSWDDIPMEFFVDKHVDDGSGGKKNVTKLRARLSVSKKARPHSLRHRKPKPIPRKREEEDDEGENEEEKAA
ncbi:Uncharacterized protein SCF082_LOCUS34970, partial [Durusdinium trenchii]